MAVGRLNAAQAELGDVIGRARSFRRRDLNFPLRLPGTQCERVGLAMPPVIVYFVCRQHSSVRSHWLPVSAVMLTCVGLSKTKQLITTCVSTIQW